MKRFRVALIFAFLKVAFSSSAAGTLLFTSVPVTNDPTPNQPLFSVSYDGVSSFVAVGSGSRVAVGTFALGGAMQPWKVNTNPGGSLKLAAVTFGNNNFVASGSNNFVFTSPDGVSWSPVGSIFGNTIEASGLACNANNGRFVAVEQGAKIEWSDAPGTQAGWHAATLNNADQSFLESFRGVTAFGTSSFAACGIFGEIRTSADSGMTWQTNRGKIGLPDLHGIAAADDGQSLVSVGSSVPNNQPTIFSTDGGQHWTSLFSGPNLNLNGVAYAGSNHGFIAVGDNGTVLTSTDGGATWPSVSGVPVTVNLQSIAFARSGSFQGVGAMVAANGSVFLLGTAPPPPNVPVNQTNFSFSLPNPPLSITISNDVDHPAGTVTIDWYNSNGTQVFADSASYSPTNSAATGNNTPANYTYYAVSRDLRTGFTNSTPVAVVLSIVPRPTSTLISPQVRTNCNDNSPFFLTNVVTGIGPWIIQWSTGDMQTNNNGGAGPVINVLTNFPTNSLPVPTNYTYSVTNVIAFLTNNGVTVMGTALASNLTGTNVLIINPRPTAMLTSLDQTNCNNGTPFTVTAALTGTAPWTVMWSDGLTLSYGTSNIVRTLVATNVNPNAPLTFALSIATLSDANTCSAQPGDLMGTNILTIYPLPPAPVSLGAVTNCFGITNPPISVTVTNGATADWFDANTNFLFAGTLSYIPTNTAVGVYTNLALTRLTNLGCTSADFTQVVFVIEDCTNAISGIKLQNGTNAVIQWYGNFVLQSATNLTPPVDWTTLTQGGAGMTNYWTNSTVPPPDDAFFRLYAPTN